jgi:hypothetical protein
MGDYSKCPSTYETYIDIFQHKYVKFVAWHFVNKMKASGHAECRKCHKEIIYGLNTKPFVEDLKCAHYVKEKVGANISYDVYLERQSTILQLYDFPPTNRKHLKVSFGVTVADGFTLIRFPLYRKGRSIHPDKSRYNSDWQRTFCKEYSENPVGSCQGHFDRPITKKFSATFVLRIHKFHTHARMR